MNQRTYFWPVSINLRQKPHVPVIVLATTPFRLAETEIRYHTITYLAATQVPSPPHRFLGTQGSGEGPGWSQAE
ncbi:jg26240, partial [Pararge aegeria aegeria]